jgi:putative phosphoesterase
MRILLVSDIHANPLALEAIREDFDVCLFVGDLVDYGIDPTPCIDWVRTYAKYAVRGNHDHGAAQRVHVQGVGGFRYLTGVTRPISIERISELDRRYLADLPTTLMVTLNGKRFFLVHGTPRDPLDEFAQPDPEFWKRRLEHVEADYVCVGHTHVQYTLQAGNATVINPGSVGLPRDGDPRPAYAIISDEGVELKRVEYPVEEAIAAIVQSDLPDPAKTLLADVMRTGRIGKNGNGNGVGLNGPPPNGESPL